MLILQITGFTLWAFISGLLLMIHFRSGFRIMSKKEKISSIVIALSWPISAPYIWVESKIKRFLAYN